MAFYFDGQIRLSWSQVRALAPFVGVSSGRPPSRQSLRLEKGYLLLNNSDLLGHGITSAYGSNVGMRLGTQVELFLGPLGSEVCLRHDLGVLVQAGFLGYSSAHHHECRVGHLFDAWCILSLCGHAQAIILRPLSKQSL